MFAPPGMGYDRAITIFSPDGRLFQVEYAIEAVRRGTTAIGIVSSEGVVTAVEKRILSLQEADSIEKIFKIDEHVGCSIAGLTADARVLVDHARVQSQINKLTYDEDIDVAMLTKKISDLLQLYTQHAGVRPFGVSLLIIGVNPNDNSPKLFMTDPSGAYWGYLAQAIGSGAQTVREILEKDYKEGITLDEAITLALKALKEVIESDFDSSKVEVAVIKSETRKFEKISDNKLEEYIKSI